MEKYTGFEEEDLISNYLIEKKQKFKTFDLDQTELNNVEIITFDN